LALFPLVKNSTGSQRCACHLLYTDF